MGGALVFAEELGNGLILDLNRPGIAATRFTQVDVLSLSHI